MLSACAGTHETQAAASPEETGPKGKVYYSFFDTVSYVYSYANDTAERFDDLSADCANILADYHRLCDIYHEYEDVPNLCTLNKNAGVAPVVLDERLLAFLRCAKDMYTQTDGEMNVMMGSVLSLWHEAREDGTYVPSDEDLRAAALHTDIELLELTDTTAYISDSDASIDVGAFAKGYAAEMAANHLEELGVTAYVLNVGGNIRIIGDKPDGSKWKTAVKDPLSPDSNFAAAIWLSDTSCVTSGVYERFYTVAGHRYHHIIDKDTLNPSEHFSSVTVVVKNSGTADALSTALFCMSEEEGKAVAEKFGAEVLWIYPDGKQSMTPGMGDYFGE